MHVARRSRKAQGGHGVAPTARAIWGSEKPRFLVCRKSSADRSVRERVRSHSSVWCRPSNWDRNQGSMLVKSNSCSFVKPSSNACA